MAIPLIWLGAAALGAYAGTKVSKAWMQEELRDRGLVGAFPGEVNVPVNMTTGAIVCCGIFEVLQHCGIVYDDAIIELKGNGLVRPVSPQRFLTDRSGNRIYIACDSHGQVLTDEAAAESALGSVYQYKDYDVLNNNCHRFVAENLRGSEVDITLFTELNSLLAEHFNTAIYWHPWSKS